MRFLLLLLRSSQLKHCSATLTGAAEGLQIYEGDFFKRYEVEADGSKPIIVSFTKTFETRDMCNSFSVLGSIDKVEGGDMYVADLRVISTKMNCRNNGSRTISLKTEDYVIARGIEGFSALVPEGFVIQVRQ